MVEFNTQKPYWRMLLLEDALGWTPTDCEEAGLSGRLGSDAVTTSASAGPVRVSGTGMALMSCPQVQGADKSLNRGSPREEQIIRIKLLTSAEDDHQGRDVPASVSPLPPSS